SDGVDISGGGEGYLMTCADDAGLRAAHEAYRVRSTRGWGEAPGPILRDERLAELEPALATRDTGGFMLPGEFSLDPVTFVASLIQHVVDSGVEVREGLTAMRIGAGASIVCVDAGGVETTVSGDRLVIAAGAWTTPI